MDMEYYNTKFDEIPKGFLWKCTTLIENNFERDVKNDIAQRIEEDGLIEWAIPYHHTCGMSVRNLFRENGLTDENLPDGNWDDYYIQVIELALGFRF